MGKVKICTGCKTEYPATLEYFYRHKQHSDNLTSQCKECLKKSRRRYGRTHKTEAIEYDKKRRRTIIGCLRDRFRSAKQRCNNPKNSDYANYGGRGIKCLFKSSNEFINYIVNELKTDPRNLEIDRIDNNGHYEIGNIRLVTHKENCNNRSRN